MKRCRCGWRLVVCAIVLGTAATGWGQETKEATPPAAADNLEVKPTPVTIVESVAARVEAPQAQEVRTDTDAWTTLIVANVAAQGTPVKAGDVILQFETDKLEDQLRAAEQELAVAQLGLEQAVEDLKVYTQLHALDEQLAEKTWSHLQEDTRYFFEVERPLAVKSAELRGKSSEYAVENATEELRQLEKMYAEDELTEESEQIVLKRAQRALEQAQFFLESTQAGVRHTLEVELPRSDQTHKEGLQRAELERARAKIAHPAELRKKEFDLAKQKFAVEKQQRELTKLRADLERMTLKAPVAGVVYHGQCKRGQWISRTGGNSRLIDVGATIPKDIVALTIVQPGPIQLRADLNEKQIATIRPGASGVARAASTGSESLPVTVAKVDVLPLDDGKYDGTLQFVNPPASLLPGMTCEVKIPVFQDDAVLTVPKAMVFSDDSGITNYVYVATGTKPERRPVILGRATDDSWVIESGLKSGDKILKKKPE